MSLSATANPTYIDLMKLMGPDGTIMPVAELLMEQNDGIVDYMTFTEGNLLNGHKHAVRTGLPTVSRGRINKGVAATKGNTAQVIDTCAELESLSEVDAKLVDSASDPAGFRLQQDRPHLEAMSQQYVRDLFYADETVDLDAYTGLTPRFSDSTADNADSIINGHGAATSGLTGSDIHSIWLIGWSPTTCTGIVPKRQVSSLQQIDYGEQWLDDDGSGNNQRLRVYRTYFRWMTGLAIPDWRYVVRCPNLKLANIKDDMATGPKLPFLMKDMIERMPSQGSVRMAFYMNRSLMQKVRRQVPAALANSSLTMEDVGGISPRKMLAFDGIPIFRVDALAASESVVTYS